jgi:hypothetical protein
METSINYIAETSILDTEKAFSTDFPVHHVKGALQSNLQSEPRPVTVTAIENLDEWKLDTHGFCVLRGHTHLDPHQVYTDKAAVQGAYWNELEAILHANFPQYSRIECFDLTVRGHSLALTSNIR